MNKLKQTIGVLFIFLISVSVKATTYSVNSQSSFDSALSSAGTNDVISWQSGTYSNIYMNVTKSNLVITAEVLGEVIFNGSSKAYITGDYITLKGFQYIGGNIGTSDVLKTTGSNNTFTEINIKDYSSYKYLVINASCQYTMVSHCNFESRVNYADKNILSVLVDKDNPGYNTIRYCSFKNFIGDGSGSAGDDGVEPIRIGLSTQGEYISRTIVEYCYFTQCNGDGEIVSNKARQNVFRYNTFEDNPESEFVLRHGDEGVIYGNFFIDGMGGIRIREGQHHAIFNNYFSGLTSRAINLQNDDSDRLDDIVIAYNTFVNNDPILLGGSGDDKPTNVIFANNIFTDPAGGLFSSATGTETWIGNIAFGNLGISNPSSGITVTDPKLVKNSEGFYGLSSSSPAIDAALAGYPALPNYEHMGIDNEVLLDVMNQSRPEPITSKDLGCSEYPQNITIQPIVTEENTGPSYLSSQDYFSLSVTNSGNGNVVLSPAGGYYRSGTEVSITAEPNANSSFLGWAGDLSGAVNPETILMDGNKNITANFGEGDFFTLGVTIVGKGTVTLTPPGGAYTLGTVVELKVTPDVSSSLVSWSGDLTGTTNPETISMDGNKSITATISEENTITEVSIAIFPNPVQDEIAITVEQLNEATVTSEIFDVSGKQVVVFESEIVPSGTSVINQNISGVIPGVYLLRTTSFDLSLKIETIKTIKFIKN